MAKKSVAVEQRSAMDFLDQLQGHARQVLQISVDSIDADPHQPRKVLSPADGIMDPDVLRSLEELAEDIKENGLIEPVLVRELENGRYRLIAGERRWRAHRLAGLDVIDAIVRQDISNAKLCLVQLSENIHREDLTDLEVGTFLKRMMEEYPELKKQDLGKLLKKNPSYVSRIMAFVDPEWAPLINEGIIPFASLLETFKALPQDKQRELIELARNEKRALTSGDIKKAREDEKAGKGKSAQAAVLPVPGKPARDPNTVDLERGKTDADLADVSEKVAQFLQDNTPPGEIYQRAPDSTLQAAPAPAGQIVDHGGNIAVIPRDLQPGDNAHSKRELKLTLDQLETMLANEAHPSGNTVVSILLPVEEMKGLLESLGGDMPNNEDQLTMAMINRLNALAAGE